MKKSLLFLIVISALIQIAGCAGKAQQVPPLSAAQTQQLYSPRGNVVLGNPNGKVTVVEFFDYQCPYCRRSGPILKQLTKDNPNVRVVYKEFLLFGPSSELATRAALAAQKQGKYLPMHDALMTTEPPLTTDTIMKIAKGLNMDPAKLKQDMGSSDVDQQIQENTDLVAALNLQGAPTFIIANTAAMNNPQKNQQIMINGITTLDTLENYVTQVSQ